MEFPQEIYDLIVEWVVGPPTYDPARMCRVPEMHLSSEAIISLKNLRLANKVFLKAASPSLFGAVSVSGKCTPQMMLDLSYSMYASMVIEITVSAEDLSHDDALPSSIKSIKDRLADLTALLKNCIRRFSNLRQITFSHTPPKGSYSGSEQTRQLFRELIYSTLEDESSKKILRLSLKLCSVQDLAYITGLNGMKVSQGRPSGLKHVMSQIQHLRVQIFEDLLTEPSKMDRPHDRGGLKFIEMATNVKSLEIICAAFGLGLNTLKPRVFSQLCFLDVTHIMATFQTLYELTTHNNQSMRTISLRNIGLSAGSWEQLLLGFCSLPHLCHIVVKSGFYDELSYFPDVEAIHEHLLENIYTDRIEDFQAFAEVQRHVLNVRGITELPSERDDWLQEHYKLGLDLLAGNLSTDGWLVDRNCYSLETLSSGDYEESGEQA